MIMFVWVHDNLVLFMIKIQIHLQFNRIVYEIYNWDLSFDLEHSFLAHRYKKTGADEWLSKKLFSKPGFYD